MKKQILLGIMAIGIIAAFLSASTFAYFSDIETSTNNTFTAGTIDLSAPYDITYSPGDLKPCQTRYLTLKVHNDGTNEMDVWKHIKNVVCAENGITEPEQVYYDNYGINYLLGYWRFEETTPWTGSPDEVIDSSSFDNHGTAKNGAIQYNPGKVGQCAKFDVDDDYIDCGDDASLDITDAVTAAAWVKLNTGGSDIWYDIVRRQTGYEISVKQSTGMIEIALNDGSWHWYDSVSTINLDGDTWYHIAFTWEKSTGKLRIYINGNLDIEHNVITNSLQSTGKLWIGGAGTAWSTYGLIDEVMIWGGALTASEIEDLYNNPGVIETSGKNDIDSVILYDMWIDNDGDTSECDENAGDRWIIQESEGFHIDDIECYYIYLGVLPPDETMTIVQSYHMEADTGNWAQSDTMTFDIEFFAQQTPGNPPLPVSELRRTTELEDIDSGLTSPTGDYRWLDIADQLYSDAYRTSYDYTQADVEAAYATVGSTLHGTLTATNLKPNFAYQVKLVGHGTDFYNPDLDAVNERIGYTGRWWRENWDDSTSAWTNGQNSDDADYLAKRDISDATSPTGLKYKFTGYLVFDYFITDENGDALLDFEADSSYHVLWKTTQRPHTTNDGPIKTWTFDPDTSSPAYDFDYGEQTVSIYGEVERTPVGGKYLPSGDYSAQMILTEESFHGSGTYAGNWAAAMGGNVQIKIV